MLLVEQTHNTVDRFGFERGVQMIHDAGFDAIDLSLFKMIFDDCEWNAPDWRELAQKRRAWADARGIRFTQAHAPFSFPWANEAQRPVFDARVANSIEIAAILGAGDIVVHPLHYFEYIGNEQKMFDMNVAYYKELAKIGEKCNIRICFENMWRNEPKRGYISHDIGSHPEEFNALIDAVGSPYVVGCLDIGHVSLTGGEPEDAIRAIGHDRLKALHVHDNFYKKDDHQLPGTGMMNWDAIMQALKDIDYDGKFTYECDRFLMPFPDDYVPEVLKFMEQTGRYLLKKIS